VSTRNCSLLILSAINRLPVIVAQACAAVNVNCVSFAASGRRRAEYTMRSGPEAAMILRESECSVTSVGGLASYSVLVVVWLAALMSAGYRWQIRLPVPATSRLAVAEFFRFKRICDSRD
jgi:hypothetical protein